MDDRINVSALVTFIEDNYAEFASYCGSEESADETLDALKEWT